MREYSIGEWIGFIAFLGVLTAVANMYLHSSVIWVCLSSFAAVVALYGLIKLTRSMVKLLNRRKGMYKKWQEQILQLKDEEQFFKGPIIEGSISQEPQPFKRKPLDFKLPPLAGFAPQRLQAPTNKKPHQGTPSLQGRAARKELDFKFPSLAGFAPEQLQKPASKKPSQEPPQLQDFTSQDQQLSKKEEAGFILPSLAGFAPEQLQKPTNKIPHQKQKPSPKKPSQEPSPSQNFVPPGLPPDLFL